MSWGTLFAMALAEIALDPETGDLRITDGQLVRLEGAEAVAQRVRVRLLTFLGEWRFDERIGTPWFQQLLGKRRGSDAFLLGIVRERILDSEGVADVADLAVEVDTRTRNARITGRVISLDGTEATLALGAPA